MSAVRKIKIDYVKNLYPIFTKPKRIKIIVGGRGSTKSTGIADYVAARVSSGELWCCARENQNSIEESVHRTLLSEINRLDIPGFEDTKTSISHIRSGGRTFYKGLARNITSLKSTLSGIHGLWIEEGEDISGNTLRVLTASVRLNAADSQKVIAGEKVKRPEIIITMNRGAKSGAIAQKYLKRAEKELARCGYYEDELIMVVEMNYTDMPRDWFMASGLEEERIDDEKQLSQAFYNHKWNGHYLDTVENAIIKPEWFDACVDAHKELGFEPEGIEVVSHDPSDEGPDDKSLVYRHGAVILDVQIKADGNVNEGGDWALAYTVKKKPDAFTWDVDGVGAGLKKQIGQALGNKKIMVIPFSGCGVVSNPDSIYEPIDGEFYTNTPKTNRQTFLNPRAQKYWELRDRCFRTYQAVINGKYEDPSELISFSSNIGCIDLMKVEMCSIPRKDNGVGKIQILNKAEMKKLDIQSPNTSDGIMMNIAVKSVIHRKRPERSYPKLSIA